MSDKRTATGIPEPGITTIDRDDIESDVVFVGDTTLISDCDAKTDVRPVDDPAVYSLERRELDAHTAFAVQISIT